MAFLTFQKQDGGRYTTVYATTARWGENQSGRRGAQQERIYLGRLDQSGRSVRITKGVAGGTEVRVDIDETLSVMADTELLSRALGNLVRNAIRYAGSQGPIQISAVSNAPTSTVTLSVVDSGPGVPEASLEQIFDPFYRIESSRSRETGGVGLGLAIVKTCVEACQGKVIARNLKPSGLQVELTLKAAETPAQS